MEEKWFVGKDGNWNKVIIFSNGKKKQIRYVGHGVKNCRLTNPSVGVLILSALGLCVAILASLF